MLSILIPIYNFDVTEFVLDLHQQALACSIPFEIRCYDDKSDDSFRKQNEHIQQLEFLVYKDLDKNLGRSKIRNLLANDAQYEYLLFVDCDSQTISPDYIKNYLQAKLENAVIYGGRSYEKNKPSDPNKFLRWYYGVKRETISVNERKARPYRSFLTNNYLIPKAIQLDVKLNESLIGYGHEDTLLSYDLKSKAVPIHHINNPLCHIGLESADEFLNKTEQGIKNLAYIIEHGYADQDIKIYGYYKRLKQLGLAGFCLSIFRGQRNNILSRLRGESPNLLWFDFYKLGSLIEVMEKG